MPGLLIEVTVAVVVGFSRTGEGHNHPQGAAFAQTTESAFLVVLVHFWSILVHFSRICQLGPTLHAPCAKLCLVAVLQMSRGWVGFGI